MVIDLNPLSVASIDEAIKAVKQRETRLKTEAWTVTRWVAEEARDQAQAGFDNAENAGPDDAYVYLADGKSTPTRPEYIVRATGSQVLFIEFGTGVLSNDNWRERGELIDGDAVRPHGHYSRTGKDPSRGNDPTGWFYKRSHQGSAALPSGTGPSYLTGKGHLMHTVGQHAQSPLWKAKNKVRQELDRIVREALG